MMLPDDLTGARRGLRSLAMIAALATAAPLAAVAQDDAVSIASLTVGGGYHSTAAGVAKVLSEDGGMAVTVKPFGKTSSWMPLLQRGEIEFGMTSGEDAAWAYQGAQIYPRPVDKLRLVVFGNRVAASPLVVRKDSGIETLKDLEGKRVYEVPGNLVVELNIEAMLDSVGLSKDDVKRVPVSSTRQGSELLRQNRLDATYGAAAQTPYIVELDRSVPLTALSYGDLDASAGDEITPEMQAKLKEFLPGSALTVQKAGAGYHTRDVVIIAFGLNLVSSTDVSEDTVYKVTKTLFENADDLHGIFPWLDMWTPETMFDEEQVAPYHDGAVKYFKEAGLWTDAAEARQQELLSSGS